MYKTLSFTRLEMFEKVWSTPLLQLAKDIGVSDVALGKACRRAKIPLPGRGYWAKDAKQRLQPTLPKNRDPFHDTIRFRVIDPEAHAALMASKPCMRRTGDGEGDHASPNNEGSTAIVVPVSLEEPHPLVAKTLKLARSAEVFEGRLVLDAEALRIRVSPDVLDRALLVMDTLLKESEQRGCTWAVTKEGTTTVTYEGEAMKIELRERLTRREIPPPPPPEPRPGRRPRWQSDYTPTYYPTKEWVSSGELTFEIDERGGQGVRRSWTDTKRKLIDVRLGDILDGLAGMAAGIKAEREKRAEWQRRWDLKQAQQAELARQIEALRLVRARMVEGLLRWEQAGRLRRFTNAVEAHLAHVEEGSADAGRQWLAWAREQADLLDPIISSFAGVTSLEVVVPNGFTGRNSWEKQPVDWWSAGGLDLTDDEDGDDAEDEPRYVATASDPSAYWRRLRSGWYGR